MALTASLTRRTPEAYLTRDRTAERKSEYIAGEIVAVAGASRNHNLIAGNLFGELRQQLKGRPCEAYTGDMRLAVELDRHFTYPDVMVVCGEPEFLDGGHFDTLLNPVLVVEVLSPTTEDYDRGRKFARCRRLGSLQDYVLVAQDHLHVEHYTRDGMRWVLSDHREVDSVVDLPAIGCRLTLAEIYERVVFDPPPGSLGSTGGG